MDREEAEAVLDAAKDEFERMLAVLDNEATAALIDSLFEEGDRLYAEAEREGKLDG